VGNSQRAAVEKLDAILLSHALATAVDKLNDRVLLPYENQRLEITHLLTDDG
jgi:hypothetical protein